MDRELLTLDDLNPFVRYAQNQYTHWRSSAVYVGKDWRLIFCYSGNIPVRIETSEYVLKQNTLILIPPHLHYRILPADDLPSPVAGVITFDMTPWNTEESKPLEPIVGDNGETYLPFGPVIPPFSQPIFVEDAGEYLSSIHNVVRLFVQREEGFRYFASSELKTILISVALKRGTPVKHSQLVRDTLNYIYLNFRETRYPREVADALGYSTAHLSRLMKAETGKTLGEFLLYYRLFISAKRLIDHPEWSVEIVAARCGFPSTSSFGVYFKKHYGTTPLEYRKRGVMYP